MKMHWRHLPQRLATVGYYLAASVFEKKETANGTHHMTQLQ